jgi:hypothetical protein
MRFRWEGFRLEQRTQYKLPNMERNKKFILFKRLLWIRVPFIRSN